MYRARFGKLVAALRKEQLDTNMRPWTQQMLGETTRLGSRTIAAIEQGKRDLDPEIVSLLAKAFQLNPAERHEFFLVASGLADSAPVFDSISPQQALDEVFSAMQQSTLPTFIHDDYGDLIAANATVLNLTGLSRKVFERGDTFLAGRFSTMRAIFDPALGYEQLLGAHWSEVATQQLHFFRRISLKHRATSHLIATLDELNRQALFKKLWVHSVVARPTPDASMIRYEHPHDSGQILRYLGMAAANRTPWGLLYLATFIPQDFCTHDLFIRLHQQDPDRAERFAEWPKPLLD